MLFPWVSKVPGAQHVERRKRRGGLGLGVRPQYCQPDGPLNPGVSGSAQILTIPQSVSLSQQHTVGLHTFLLSMITDYTSTHL